PTTTFGHELVELGAVLGRPELVEIVAELALLFVELAQRLLAVFVERDVARRMPAAPVTALPGAPFFAARTPLLAGGLTVFGCVPAAVMAMLPTGHASTPFQVDQKGEANRPEHDEAEHHQGDPRRLGHLVQSLHHAVHGASSLRGVNGCKC